MTDILLSTGLIARIAQAIAQIGPLRVSWDGQETLTDQQINILLALPDGLEFIENELRGFHSCYFLDIRKEALRRALEPFKPAIAGEWEMDTSQLTEEHIEGVLENYGFYDHLPLLDLDMQTIITQTKPRVTLQLVLYQDYMGWEWPLTMEYEDARDVLDLFHINPRKILPIFPDFPWRNNKSYVDSEALRDLWSSAPEGGQYVVALDLDLWYYHEHRNQFHTGIVLPKGTEIWLHDYYQGIGSGSCVTLSKDLTILKRNLTYFFGDDNKTIGQGLADSNHFTQAFWASKIFPVKAIHPTEQTLRPIPKLLRAFRYEGCISVFQFSTSISAFNDFSPLENGDTPAPGQKMEMDLKCSLWRQFPIEGKRCLREQADKNAMHMVFRISEMFGQVRILHCQFVVNDDTREVVWKSVLPLERSEDVFEYLASIILKTR